MRKETEHGNPVQVFDSQDVLTIVGIQPIYLNKFVERGQYGIVPSVRKGGGRGSRRLFNAADVFGIALTWWLFESGLRSGSIQYVLNQVCGRKLNSNANDAARVLIERDIEVLTARREPRLRADANREYPRQQTSSISARDAAQLVIETDKASLLILPVGNLFATLKESMQILARRR